MSDDAPRIPGNPAMPAESGAQPGPSTSPSAPGAPAGAGGAGAAEPAERQAEPAADRDREAGSTRAPEPPPAHKPEPAADHADAAGPGPPEPPPACEPEPTGDGERAVASAPAPEPARAPEPPLYVEPAPEPPAADWGELSDAFLTIWTRPRDTIRRIVAVDPTYWLLPLASLGGGSSFLGTASSGDMGDRVSTATIVIMAIVVGPLLGIAGVYIFGWLVARTGAWLQGGRGDVTAVRAALAWAYVPYIALLPLLLLASVLIPGIYRSDMSAAGPVGATLGLLLGFIASVLGIWSFVLTCHTVAEVQGYRSAWRGLVNLILPAVLGVGIVVALVLVIGGLAAVLRAF